ncbi:EF-hand calcium-binding domain-containing protein 11 isoform X5 [Vicugna pacos]|uniref:EF-hand calcium-binding domain-containing protein 11 isoform X5 n=1 Tax=Vicugna pacos TaxID=30538 RepID=A0ABM5DFK0_VICPA
MFFSQAGARPQMWEVSPSEHKKWVEVFKACDEDNKGYLSREDFKVAVVMLFGYKPSKIEADSVMSSVDPNTSDRGYLTLEDFTKAFRQVAPKLPERIILEVFRSKAMTAFCYDMCDTRDAHRAVSDDVLCLGASRPGSSASIRETVAGHLATPGWLFSSPHFILQQGLKKRVETSCSPSQNAGSVLRIPEFLLLTMPCHLIH